MRFRRRGSAADPPAEHHLSVDHADYGSRAYCDCGWVGSIRLDVDDATLDADEHLVRARAADVIGLAAYLVTIDTLARRLGVGHVDDELGVAIAVYREQVAQRGERLSGWG